MGKNAPPVETTNQVKPENETALTGKPTETKMIEVVEQIPTITSKKVTEKKEVLKHVKDSDKCSLFSAFVEQYALKKNDGCTGAHCGVYKRQLKKFRMKKQRYC